jgi:ArsR family transcriptional regulator
MAGRCPHVTIEATPDDDADSVDELALAFARMEELENELSLAQRWVHGRKTELLDRLNELIGAEADSRFYANVLAAIAAGESTVESIAEEVNAPRPVVEEALGRLVERGLVDEREGDDGWRIVS